MRLVPAHPPGRGTRKAREFESEIVELRVAGYTFEAIRVALANAGVHVTISTVRREANRRTTREPVMAATQSDATGAFPVSCPQSAATPSATALVTPGVQQERRGKEVAETFMRTQITNPLIRAKEKR